WWCADPLAKAAFRGAMLAKYSDAEGLNAAWKTAYTRSSEIEIPSGPNGISRRRWLDFVEWYRGSAAQAAQTVTRAAKRAFPSSLMVLAMGFADENPRGGNDNSLIPALAAKEKVEIRSSHGGLKPFAQGQASMLGRIASACRFYGVPFWSEPPGRVTAE